ncbi:uncharacterized protein K444DRAFT_609631, partial [Hyaloscypha bicolor E]
MPPLTQPLYLCHICFQLYFDRIELLKHYNSSHGDENEFPKDGEGGGSEDDSEDSEGAGNGGEGCVMDKYGKRDQSGESLDVMFP